MEPLNIPGTRNTPAISFAPEHAWFRVVGSSIPENASTFYTPVLDWLKRHINDLPDGVNFEFSLPYFNSSSLKALYLVLLEVKNARERGKHFMVTWYVEPEDDFMQEAGETYQEMLNMKINFVPGLLEI